MRPRITCRLLGCVIAEEYPGCHRCQSAIYDVDFVQIGRLDFVFRAYWRTRKFVQKFTGKRCAVCNKRFWRGDDWTCSDKCFSDWLPF